MYNLVVSQKILIILKLKNDISRTIVNCFKFTLLFALKSKINFLIYNNPKK